MSISSIINRNNYIGNDSTAVYSYSFKVFTKNDFEIKVRDVITGIETLLVVDVDYTVSGAGTISGGSITLIGAGAWLVSSKLTTGYELSIRRLREIKQLADIKNQGSFYPETHEDVFDKLTMVDLQQQDSIDRSIKFSSSVNPADFDTDLPALLVGAASKSFITNATGDGFEPGPTADEISNAQSYAIASAASAAAALVSETNAAASAAAAGVSETNAAASAAAAGVSETNAASSAAAAAGEVAAHAALTATHGVAGNIVGTTDTQTLTNKTLTAPIISQISNTGTVTLPTATDTLVGRATTDVLTNKDIDGGTASNTNRITLPKNTKTNLDLLTRKQATLVYDTANNKVFYDNGTILVELASISSVDEVGKIDAFGRTAANVPSGYLYCNGQAVSRTTYSALYTALGTAYGTGDGTTTFNIPDLRGQFLRGQDNGRGLDPDRASRPASGGLGGNTGDNVGSAQAGAIVNHTHQYIVRTVVGNTVGGVAGSNGVNDATNTTATGNPDSGASTETRPVNLYVNYFIRY